MYMLWNTLSLEMRTTCISYRTMGVHKSFYILKEGASTPS